MQEQPPKQGVTVRFRPRALRPEATPGGGGDRPGTGPRSRQPQLAPSRTPAPEARLRAPRSAGWGRDPARPWPFKLLVAGEGREEGWGQGPSGSSPPHGWMNHP